MRRGARVQFDTPWLAPRQLARRETAISSLSGTWKRRCGRLPWTISCRATDPEYVGGVESVHEGGQALRGLRWARNQGVHQLVALHKMSEGRTYPLTYSRRYVEPVWLAARNGAPRQAPTAERAGVRRPHSGANSKFDLEVQEFLWMRAIPNQYREELPWEASTSNG